MKAIILSAGRGSRLLPLTETLLSFAVSAPLISLTVVGRLVSTTRSMRDTLGVGTRTAMPVRRPASSGSTRPIALAAPVVVGTMFCAAARARRSLPFLWGASSRF